MRNLPNTQEGGTTGVFRGSLKRRLKTITVARLSSVEGGTILTATATQRLLLKNLNGDLNVQIAIGVLNIDGSPLRPSAYPTPGGAAGTVQLTPINNFPDAQSKIYVRPVFQDPTLATNENHPLAEEIPFGYEFNTRADEVEIEIVLTVAEWVATNINGNIVCQVTIEYDGQWWDVEAIQYALSQVTLQGGSDSVEVIATGGD